MFAVDHSNSEASFAVRKRSSLVGNEAPGAEHEKHPPITKRQILTGCTLSLTFFIAMAVASAAAPFFPLVVSLRPAHELCPMLRIFFISSVLR